MNLKQNGMVVVVCGERWRVLLPSSIGLDGLRRAAAVLGTPTTFAELMERVERMETGLGAECKLIIERSRVRRHVAAA